MTFPLINESDFSVNYLDWFIGKNQLIRLIHFASFTLHKYYLGNVLFIFNTQNTILKLTEIYRFPKAKWKKYTNPFCNALVIQ